MRTAFVVAGLAAAVIAETYTVTHTEDVTITSCAPTVTNCPYKKTTSTPAAGDFTWGEWDSDSESWDDWETSTMTSAGSTTITSVKKTTKPATATSTSTEVWGEWDPSSSTTDEWGIWDSTTATDSTSTKTKTTGTVTSVKVSTTNTAACPSYTATGPPEWFSLLPSDVLSSIAAKWTGAPPADWCYYTYSTSSISTSATPVAATSSPYYPITASTPVKATGTGAAKSSGTVTGPVAKWTGAANSNAGSMALAGLAAAAAIVLA